MVRTPIMAAALLAMLGAAACAPGMGGLAPASSRSGGSAATAARASGLSDSMIAACRTEAERATVQQNRGEMMRLDEAENRGADSLMQNQIERGLLVTRRDQLFRDCLGRAGTQTQAAPAAAAPAAPAARQTAVPR